MVNPNQKGRALVVLDEQLPRGERRMTRNSRNALVRKSQMPALVHRNYDEILALLT